MNLISSLRLLVCGTIVMTAGKISAQDDPGKMDIGKVAVTVFYATNGDPKTAGEKFSPVAKKIENQLRNEKILQFKHYRFLGKDIQPLFRSYENWAQPLKPSDEVLVRFEARKLPTSKSSLLDLEIWFSRKKILKTDALLEGPKPLFILGPEWRGGRLIISVALATDSVPSS